MIDVKIKLLRNDVKIPKPALPGDACVDVHAAIDEPVKLLVGERRKIGCGFAMELPAGYEAQIRPRSGLALKRGITVLNAPGTIDSGYRNEVGVVLVNLGELDHTIQPGDRIASMAVRHAPEVRFHDVPFLSETVRGKGGFGSTGIGQYDKTSGPKRRLKPTPTKKTKGQIGQ